MHPALPPHDAVARTRVLVVGDTMLDRYWFGAVERISPEAPVPVGRVEREERFRARPLKLGGVRPGREPQVKAQCDGDDRRGKHRHKHGVPRLTAHHIAREPCRPDHDRIHD